ncbi:hypothetical protein PR003_g30436 [Phytophthora rubi]|uniref:Uncharacterized protein n=1 Tax=Phytophthora rubi TaxID=129364 RepID=A0A6A4BAH5_9STRA|nr:hypothetical protein PR001_g29634 [Phytophthora rubi]KAE8962776.1 hypothetical protein PR002_g29503 [Phytophthora rubi]KAE9271696.1 hypothetical protein PR003_g30436 [Phytophthora rubi]
MKIINTCCHSKVSTLRIVHNAPPSHGLHGQACRTRPKNALLHPVQSLKTKSNAFKHLKSTVDSDHTLAAEAVQAKLNRRQNELAQRKREMIKNKLAQRKCEKIKNKNKKVLESALRESTDKLKRSTAINRELGQQLKALLRAP